MVTLLKNDFQKEESRNIDRELALEKQLEPKLYDGSVIQKTNAIVIRDSEETLMLEDKSRSKMLQKQNDLMISEKKVNTTPNSGNSEEPNLSLSTTIVEVPKELPIVSMVNLSLKKLKFHLASFDVVVKERTTATAITDELLKIDVAPLAPKLRNNMTTYYDYLKHTQGETATLREIVKNERLLNPLNTSLDYTCKYTKRVQELLIILKQTCPCINSLGTKLMVVTPINKNKNIWVTKHTTSSGNTPIKTTSPTNVVSNKPTGVNLVTSASGSQSQGNTKKDRIQQTQIRAKKNKIEDHPRNVRPSLHNKKSVVNTKAISSVPNSKLNVNSDHKCATCNGCLFSNNHDSCVLEFINSVNARVKSKSAKKPVNKQIWKPTGKYLDSGFSKHMIGDRSQLINFVQKFLGTIKFKNDHVAKIMGYGDYKIGNVTISRVYFVEGLGHNLFSVGQFWDSELEVAFCQHTCFICNSDGVDLLTGSRGNNLYTLSLGDMMASLPICLLSKASKTKSWLWHRRLSHLNFGTINHLARQGLVQGLPKLKLKKDHLCSACAMGKSKKKSHKPKSDDTNQEKVYLLHMDLCGPIRVESVNGKKYILVIADDYSQFTWVKFLRSKEEAPDFIIKFLKMIQVRIKVTVSRIRIDNGTEFVNQTLREYYEHVGISHETSVAHSPQLNGVVERRNRTLIEAAHTIKHSRFTTDVRRIVETIHVDFDDLMAMASEQSSSGPTLNEMTPVIISLGLVSKPSSLTPYVPPSRNDWDLLFQPLFDELLTPPPSVDPPAPEVIASIADVIPLVQSESTGLPSSTTVDQDAPSP
nr:retrovirus-related Pol polyprotein from transposon TNT 1-94 [Tanacetum cinerariifolium]